MSSSSGTTSSQSALPAATMISERAALGWPGAVTQTVPLRRTAAASWASRSMLRSEPSGPMWVTAQAGTAGRAEASAPSAVSTTAKRQPAASKQAQAAASSAAGRFSSVSSRMRPAAAA